MEVKYKRDELYHFGIKGMKWKHHKVKNRFQTVNHKPRAFDQQKQNVLAAGAEAREKLDREKNGKLSTKAKRFADSWNEAREDDFKTVDKTVAHGKKKIKKLLGKVISDKTKVTYTLPKKKNNNSKITITPAGKDSNGWSTQYTKTGGSNKWATSKTKTSRDGSKITVATGSMQSNGSNKRKKKH